MMQMMYPRYGGMLQSCPLTEADKLYDQTCEELDRLVATIGNMKAGLFTAYELLWFAERSGRTVMFPRQEDLDREKRDLQDLLDALNRRM